MKRRQFLSMTGGALALSLSNPLQAVMASGSRYIDNIGLQLWTVRNQLAEDVPATLKAVADAGYKQVELMNVLKADEVVPAAKGLGLDVTSAFIDWQSIGNPDADGAPSFDRILEKAKSLGLKHLVYGYIGKGHRETADQFKGHADRANVAGEKCKAAGIQLCYHNHSFEFAKVDGDKTGFDIFIDRFDTNLVKFEVDVFWVKIGGWNPISTLNKLSKRVSQVHLKDLKPGTGVIHDEGKVPHEAFKELGNGEIDMADVLKVAEAIGADQCHVEQDQSPGPIASIGESMQHLQSL